MPADDAERIAAEIHAAYTAHAGRFANITRRARHRFEAREWRGGQWDAAERLMLYRILVDQTVQRLTTRGAPPEAALGAGIKRAFARAVDGRSDVELAETFFNSVVRRVFGTVGVNAALEFFDTAAERPAGDGKAAYRTYRNDGDAAATFRAALLDVGIGSSLPALDREAAELAARVEPELRTADHGQAAWRLELLPNPFFRNKAAYLVGRIRTAGAEIVPILIALLHGPDGIRVDAVLTTSDEISVVFGFTRSYFQVETEHPRAVVDFLRTVMPRKRVDELYTSIGHHKHGKRELFRELQLHLAAPDARFATAEGKRGLVMIVFTLPAFNVVFKVIRDRFGPTKQTSRATVMERYRMVFLHDRVGRLADAQEFEMLEFRRSCFAPELLDELCRDAADQIRFDGDRIVVRHLYTERRVTPLDLFLESADAPAARAAIVDYGDAIRDLAAANIFPGDMLLKNFGVTRHGRVVFYDYDELQLLGEVNFRRMPEPRDPYDEMAAEPWFHVGENDVFPEEFLPFLVPAGPLRDAFVEHHGELLDVDFWRHMQQRQQAGEVIDFFPYPAERRLEPEPA